VVREAFFPRGPARFAVEPARPDDLQPILDITDNHDGHAAASCMESWWRASREAFFVVRAPDQPVAGFYCLLDAATAISAEDILRHDKVTARFVQDLRQHPTPARQTALFVRRWLGRLDGERPSAVQAACWLDVKRHYLERRPRLRRVYLALHDLEPYAVAAGTLGFKPLPDPVLMGIGSCTPQSSTWDRDRWMAGFCSWRRTSSGSRQPPDCWIRRRGRCTWMASWFHSHAASST